MVNFNTVAELVQLAEEKSLPLHDIVLAREMHTSARSKQALLDEMQTNWNVMCAAIERGIKSEERSVSGLAGGDAKKLMRFAGKGFLETDVLQLVAYAVGVSEVNAVMGRIVACPTAGSCGILPAALYAAQRKLGADDAAIVAALFTAAGVGMIVDQNASIAGAEGGCQAECGTAAGMAAAALTELAGGTPAMCANACALAIKNLLGLACDPVAGLVEVPCVKRNGFCVLHAVLAADMSLAGVQSVLPADDVIAALAEIGDSMPHSLKETATGGLAATETGRRLAAKIYPARANK